MCHLLAYFSFTTKLRYSLLSISWRKSRKPRHSCQATQCLTKDRANGKVEVFLLCNIFIALFFLPWTQHDPGHFHTQRRRMRQKCILQLAPSVMLSATMLHCLSLPSSEVYFHFLLLIKEIFTRWGTGKSFWLQFSSVARSCPTLCDPLDCSMPGLPVHHQLPELTQTHVYCVGDAIQPSHLPSFPSPPTFHLSQQQGLFQWVGSSHQVAKVLEFQLQLQFLQWIFRTYFL